jgi:cytochrome c5
MRLRWIVLLALAAAAVLSAQSFAASTTRIAGTAKLKPIKAAACKARSGKVNGKAETDINCQDTGLFQGAPRRNTGAAYSWYWRMRSGKPVKEVGTFTLNFGNGVVYLSLKGTFRTVGKATKTRGVGRTTGKWRFMRGTGAYKGGAGSGTYRLDMSRNATTYRMLNVKLTGSVR